MARTGRDVRVPATSAFGLCGVILALGPVGELSFAAPVAVLGIALWPIIILAVRGLGANDGPAATTF